MHRLIQIFVQNLIFLDYHKEERRQIKKILKLYKNPQGYLPVEAFKNFFFSKDREEKTILEEPAKPEDLAILFDMISSVEGSLSQEIDLKKMKEFTKSLNIDEDDDRSLALMYKFARNSETGKLKKEDLVGLARIFQRNQAL